MPTPAELGYRMPAEWEPHEATWIAWPHQRRDWPGRFGPIPWVYTEIVRQLAWSRTERVRILVNGAKTEASVRRTLDRYGAGALTDEVDFYHVPTDRSWVRDYGPIFVKNAGGEVAATDWQFNAWAKYPDWHRDDAVPQQLARSLQVPRWEPTLGQRRVVLEGGSIDVNGRGLLLTTEECLLSDVQARNPGFSRADYEKVFADYLGVTKVIWLGRGIVGDDTHGHVDDLARFVNPRTVVAAVSDNATLLEYDILRENLERLRGATNPDGRKLEVVPLPMPLPRLYAKQWLPASYANFYIANDRVLVPTFNDPNDRKALGILAELFPDRQVVGIHAVDLVWGLGTLHCLTQQQPARGG